MSIQSRVRLGFVGGAFLLLLAGAFLYQEGYFRKAQFISTALAVPTTPSPSCDPTSTIQMYQARVQAGTNRTVTISAPEVGGNTYPLRWKTWGTGAFARKFRACNIAITDISDYTCKVISSNDNSGSTVTSYLNRGKNYFLSMNCSSTVLTSSGTSVLPEVTDAVTLQVDPGTTSTPALPPAPVITTPKYQEL